MLIPTHPRNTVQATELLRSIKDSESINIGDSESSLNGALTNHQPVLQNIVSTISVGCRLNLKHISESARNAEYNPRRFSAVIMRIREPRTTALIFTTGKLVITGAKSEDLSKLAARKFTRILQKLGYAVKFEAFRIQNIVASCDIGFEIRLERLAVGHWRYSCYEPELFPGLVYRMISPRVVLLIFVSGKMVITGAREREEIDEAFRKIMPVVALFKKIHYPTDVVEKRGRKRQTRVARQGGSAAGKS